MHHVAVTVCLSFHYDGVDSGRPLRGAVFALWPVCRLHRRDLSYPGPDIYYSHQ